MAPFDDLVYAYFKQFKQLNYPQDVKDKCLVHLLKCLIEYDRNHKDAIIGIEDEKSYQHLSNFMSKDKHLVDRLKKTRLLWSHAIKRISRHCFSNGK